MSPNTQTATVAAEEGAKIDAQKEAMLELLTKPRRGMAYNGKHSRQRKDANKSKIKGAFGRCKFLALRQTNKA
jgi:hypothetical protein